MAGKIVVTELVLTRAATTAWLTTRGPRSGARYGAGCWDWSGAISADFDTHKGVQLAAVFAMLDDLTSILS